jgi:hypothetical protein
MSATIILIITSSSTRKTEAPGGRVAVMRMSLPVLRFRIANNAKRRNVNVRKHASRAVAARSRRLICPFP